RYQAAMKLAKGGPEASTIAGLASGASASPVFTSANASSNPPSTRGKPRQDGRNRVGSDRRTRTVSGTYCASANPAVEGCAGRGPVSTVTGHPASAAYFASEAGR